MRTTENLKIAIDARVTPGLTGGVAQAIMSLVHGIGQLKDGDEFYTIVVASQAQWNWLQPFLGPNQQLVMQTPALPTRKRSLLKRALLPAVWYLRGALSTCSRHWPEVPISDGFYESLSCDVLHFPTQSFALCAIPTIYNPHDLQHLSYPQFFSPGEIVWRETIYPAGCRFAQTVVVGSQWVKDDVVRKYRISSDKVQVIPEAPPPQLYAEPAHENLAEVKSKYQLEEPFALYPAVTWAHKNHLRLLEALAYLRDTRGLIVRLVCTGSRYEGFWSRIEQHIAEFKLEHQVRFVGFVPDQDLRAIYRLAQFLVSPSLFEASSLPMFEAWLEGVPVACSNATALPDQAQDAALLFDPTNVEAIANAVAKLATDTKLRQELRVRGYQRLKDFDRERTAKAYRAVYRRAAGRPLSEEDRWLLKWDWMRESHKSPVVEGAT